MQLYKTFGVDDAGKISGYGGARLKAVGDGDIELLIYSAEGISQAGSAGTHQYTIPVKRLIELIGEGGIAT